MKVDIIHHREDIPLDDLRVVYDHWHEKLGGRFAPAWQDVDMVCFPPRVIPMCLVIDIWDQPRDFVFRFWGTGFTDMHGADFTARSLDDLPTPGAISVLREQYNELIVRRRPLTHVVRVTANNDVSYTNTAIRLPLSSDGENIDKILVAVSSHRNGILIATPEARAAEMESLN